MASPRKGFEPSEIFAAVAMFYSASQLETIKKDLYSVIDFITESRAMLTNQEGGVVFGSADEQGAFESYFTWQPTQKKPFPEPWQITNMCQGISAALAIKDWLSKDGYGTIAQTVYMTGKQWPREVRVFNIDVRGFASYNSSDIIIKPQGNSNAYMGVSLKKKPTVESVDPTMINKAFDTILGNNRAFQAVKDELVRVRTEYFGGLVKEASGDSLQDHIHIGPSKFRNAAWLFSGHTSDDRTIHNMDPKRAFIDTKGSMQMKEILGPKDTTVKNDWGKAHPDYPGWDNYGDSMLNKSQLASRTDTMRYWVNRKLATDRTLYDKMLGVMNNNAKLFGEQLLSVTLRTDVLEEIKKRPGVRRLGDVDFGFALVTGIGKPTTSIPTAMKIKDQEKEMQRAILNIPKGKAYEIGCVLRGLAHLDAPSSGTNEYKFAVKQREEPHVSEDDAGAAKLIFNLLKNDTPILAMELRFKGGFTSQPQFQGYMTNKFKDVLDGECI